MNSNTDLDLVAPEHELADDDPTDAAGGADDEDGGVLRAGDGELAHGPPDQNRFEGFVGRRPRDLAQARELAPNLVEYLARSAAEPERVHIVQRQRHGRLRSRCLCFIVIAGSFAFPLLAPWRDEAVSGGAADGGGIVM